MKFSSSMAVLCALTTPGMVRAQAIAPRIATGNGYGVLVKSDGTLWVWGRNNSGQLAIEDEFAAAPVRVPGLSSIRDVAAGDFFTLALKNDGTVWGWGDNREGQLGHKRTPNSAKPEPVAGLNGIAAISANGQRGFAIKGDGTLWMWGYDSTLRLSPTPSQVKGLTDVTAVAAALRTNVALKSDGTVWAWGESVIGLDLSGQPEQVSGLTDITAIAAGDGFILALKKDGTVWATGNNGVGQLGNGTTENPGKPVLVSGLAGVKAVAAGESHGVALKRDGTVWSWGYNHSHQLGNPKVDAEQSTKPVRSGALAGVTVISAASRHSAALAGDAIWAWGDNEGGVLGADEHTDHSDVPMRVGQSLPAACNLLFSCETDNKKMIRICGEQDSSDVNKWTAVQYRFGPDNGPPELMFPKDPEKGPPQLFFSHEYVKSDYRVSVRFTNGAYTYRVFSATESGGGVEVTDAQGKRLSTVMCAERPYLFIEYLRMNLPCDTKNPHGAAACQKSPYRAR